MEHVLIVLIFHIPEVSKNPSRIIKLCSTSLQLWYEISNLKSCFSCFRGKENTKGRGRSKSKT